MYANQVEQTAAPQTTLELLKYIGKKLPKQLLKALPVMVIVGIVSWLVHTYLLVKTNEGFNPDTWLGQNFLNVKGGFLNSTFLWAMMGGAITMLLSSLLRGINPFKSFINIVKIPGNIIKKDKEMGHSFLPFLLIACGVSLLFEKLISGVAGIIAGGLILSSVAAFATGTGGIFAIACRMIFADVQSFILRKQKTRMDNDAIYIILGASGLVFAFFGLLKSTNIIGRIFGGLGNALGVFGGIFFFFGNAINWILSIIWIVFIALGIALIFTKKNAPKTMIFFALFFVSFVAAQRLVGVSIFADDGGWAESGSAFIPWITSEGAIVAILMGLPPSIAGIVGSLIASILSGLGGGIGSGLGALPVDITPPDAGVPQEPQTPQEPQEPQKPQEPQEPQKPQENDANNKSDDSTSDEAKERERVKQELERKRQEYDRLQQEKEANKQRELQKALEQEQQRKEEYIQKLCKKYNTTPDKLRETLAKNIAENSADVEKWNRIDKVLWVGEKMAVATVVVSDNLIDGMASVGGPGAKAVRAVYKVTKGAASSGAEGGWTTENIVGGAVSGTADAITDIVDNPYGKAAVTIIGETAGGAIKGGTQGAKDGFVNGVFSAGVNAGADKLAGNGYGNEMSSKFHQNGTATVSIKTKSGWVDKTVSGSTAIKFQNNKIGAQIKTSAIKTTVGLSNELAVKPALQDAKYLPK